MYVSLNTVNLFVLRAFSERKVDVNGGSHIDVSLISSASVIQVKVSSPHLLERNRPWNKECVSDCGHFGSALGFLSLRCLLSSSRIGGGPLWGFRLFTFLSNL